MKRYEIENVSGTFVSVHAGGKIVAFPPGSSKPVRDLFRGADGQADMDACRANESLAGHMASGKLRLVEHDVAVKVPSGPGPLYNEDDPEELRVAKILAWRQKLKAELTAPAPRSPKKAPKDESKE